MRKSWMEPFGLWDPKSQIRDKEFGDERLACSQTFYCLKLVEIVATWGANWCCLLFLVFNQEFDLVKLVFIDFIKI